MSIHRLAAEGYRNVADRYDHGRAGYPSAAVDALLGELAIGTGATVVELGAGTGKFTADVVGRGVSVVAVEPVADMRRKLADNVAGVDIRDGTAEAIPVEDGVADSVVVAQAFHWFDGPAALREIARVLRPSGGLGLIWNVVDRSQPWVAEIWSIIDSFESDAPRYYKGEWRSAFDRHSAFTPFQHRTFDNPVRVDVPALVDRVLSISFIAAAPHDERESVARRVREVATTVPEPLEIPYRTDVFWCFRAAG